MRRLQSTAVAMKRKRLRAKCARWTFVLLYWRQWRGKLNVEHAAKHWHNLPPASCDAVDNWITACVGTVTSLQQPTTIPNTSSAYKLDGPDKQWILRATVKYWWETGQACDVQFRRYTSLFCHYTLHYSCMATNLHRKWVSKTACFKKK